MSNLLIDDHEECIRICMQVYDQLSIQITTPVWNQVQNRTWIQIKNQTWDAIRNQVYMETMLSIKGSIKHG